MSELDLTFVDQTVEQWGRHPRTVIPILQAIQTHYRYVPREALQRVCELTDITPATITGVSTFYTQFRHRPVGEHIICVCHGTACHVKGSQVIHDAFDRQLGIAPGEDTDPDGLFTTEKVACLGCCTLAPVVQIDGATYGHLAPGMAADVIDDFLRQQRGGPESKSSLAVPEEMLGEFRIALDSCCIANGTGKVHAAIRRTLAESGAAAELKRVTCVSMCYNTPVLELVPKNGPPKLFVKVSAEEAPAIVLKHFRPKGLRRRIGHQVTRWLDCLLTDETGDPAVERLIDPSDGQVCAFMGRQQYIATEYCGQIDPTNLDEYLHHGGFETLRRCREELSPGEIIEQCKAGGLRGRGGAGFPTGLKWEKVRAAAGEKKYIICNGDEGDPGAFMDRMLLESFPYRIIEGLAIAARAVGADEGFFYIRAEYPHAIERIREAVDLCRERGLLGDELKLSIMQGAGAFVCGEETALLASIEGRRGMPRLRPPYPADSGLWGKPTSVNNVETYALLPWIFRHGPEEFAKLGTEHSKGTKVFALAGKLRRGGLIEVPMGITIREIVEEIGGGVAGDHQFKAVQIGGPSGGCVPAALADTPIDFEALAEVGAIMGSGGLVVLDDADCMVDIARYFLRFTQDQSCGKCTFCRIGTRRMLDILDRICTGQGKHGDLERLEQLAHEITAGSICGLGGTAPNPVLSTLRYFREEYEAHLEGRCPAGRCKDLIVYRVTDDCIGCTLCAQHCPAGAIPMTPYWKHWIDPAKCTRCDTCRQICPSDAVVVE